VLHNRTRIKAAIFKKVSCIIFASLILKIIGSEHRKQTKKLSNAYQRLIL
jgi:hypothetical protein